MNSKGHFILSTGKSVLRIASCIMSLVKKDTFYMITGFLVAEVLGIAEELVDKR